LLIAKLEDLEPYTQSSDEVQRQMRWCWNSSFQVAVDDIDAAQLYVNNSCHSHQLSLMAWLYDGAVGMYIRCTASVC